MGRDLVIRDQDERNRATTRISLTADGGRRTLWDVIHAPHSLQTRARGILGRGREIRLDEFGGAGSLRGWSSLGLESVGISVGGEMVKIGELSLEAMSSFLPSIPSQLYSGSPIT
jgi:hypothetical protein